MWIVHEVLHAMFDINKRRFCWCIHIATEAHYDILRIIVILDSDVHESTNPVFIYPIYDF